MAVARAPVVVTSVGPRARGGKSGGVKPTAAKAAAIGPDVLPPRWPAPPALSGRTGTSERGGVPSVGSVGPPSSRPATTNGGKAESGGRCEEMASGGATVGVGVGRATVRITAGRGVWGGRGGRVRGAGVGVGVGLGVGFGVCTTGGGGGGEILTVPALREAIALPLAIAFRTMP